MSKVLESEINTSLHPGFFEYSHELQGPLSNPLRQPSVTEDQKKDLLQQIVKGEGDVPMYDETPRKNYASKVLSNIQEVTPFSKAFFSAENIKEVQRLVRYNIYIHSDKKYVIDNQDETELVIVMRSQYLSHARVQADTKGFKKEIERLNGLVVKAVLPDLLSNVEQYIGYIRDSTQAYTPLDRATNNSVRGERTLRSVSDVLVGDDVFFGQQ